MKTSIEIRDYFLDMLNHALPRLGMYGGEIAARQLLSHLAFIDERDNELCSLFDALRTHGAFNSAGVGGAFHRRTGLQATDGEIASVYANVAFKMGYLSTERILPQAEFDLLESSVRESCHAFDLNADDIRARFGDPSWQAGTNPYYPWVFLYLCPYRDHSVAFDFWNVYQYDKQNEVTSGVYGNVPVLRDVRLGAPNFASEFVFTPIGLAITKLP